MHAVDHNESGTEDDAEFVRLLRSASILVVDDEPGMRNFLKRALENRCALLEVAGSAEEAEALRLRYHFDVLLVDIRLPGLTGIDWLARLRERGVRTHVIYMTAYAEMDMAVGALRNGADDFIMKPFRMEQMMVSIRCTLMRGQILRENSLLRLQIQQMQREDGFIGECPPVKHVLAQVQRMATTSSCVLILGQSGTGKSLLAKTLHAQSRRQGALVAVGCAALHDSSEEEELFGPEGLFMHADNGTLVLDDIHALSSRMQAMLAQIIEHGKLRHPGLSAARQVDVRVVATTSVDLKQRVDSGNFRADLHYRLNALPLEIPPLSDRGDDIKLLADAFMQRFANQLRVAPVELLHDDWAQLIRYPWPGNVRELGNVIERTLLLGYLPGDSLVAESSGDSWGGPGFPLTFDLEAVERAHIEAVLASVGNNKSAAARILGVSRKTLERKQAIWYGD